MYIFSPRLRAISVFALCYFLTGFAIAVSVKNYHMDIVHVGSIDDGFETERVRFVIADAARDAAARHPHGESVVVVIAAGSVLALAERHAPKLTAPDDQR